MAIKDSAISFPEMVGIGKVEEAFENYTNTYFFYYIQYFERDRESLKNAMTIAHQKSPNKAIKTIRTFEESDHMITLSPVLKQDDGHYCDS